MQRYMFSKTTVQPIVRLLLVGVALLPFSLPATAQIPARRADDFVDSIGVCTHWNYPDTPYGYAYEAVKALLGASGIRHVRDGLNNNRLPDLWASYGIRATVLFNPGDAKDVVRQVREARPRITMVEGPNEVVIFESSAKYKGVGYPEGPRAWMKDLYTAMKADPITATVPVIAPSTGRVGGNGPLAPLTSFDYCVMHSYAGGAMPTSSLYSDMNNNLTDAYEILGKGETIKPIVVTESGYHTALGSNVVIGGAQPGVSEKAQAKYLPRHFAEYWNAGILRTFTYEFINEFEDYKTDEREATNAEACFGIIKRDLNPKPAYRAIRNLIALLGEARWNVVDQRWERPNPTFAPRALNVKLTGAPPTVHATLLQKADNTYYLLLWNEVPSFDTGKREEIAVPEVPVELVFSRTMEVTVYRPGASLEPVGEARTVAPSVKVSVPDEVIVVRINPGQEKLPPQPPAEQLRVSATATNDTIQLQWKTPTKNPPAGYFVYRQSKFLGKAEGNTYKDERLIPGLGYPYTIVPFDAQGRNYPAATVTVRTKNHYPDLVVEEVAFEGAVKPGEPVKFTAKITNRGSATTPADTTHGVAFFVGDQLICWSDSFRGPLKPGESKTVTSNNGPGGVPHWVPKAGKYTVRAFVDDVRRIVESERGNNYKDREVTVGP